MARAMNVNEKVSAGRRGAARARGGAAAAGGRHTAAGWRRGGDQDARPGDGAGGAVRGRKAANGRGAMAGDENESQLPLVRCTKGM